MYLSKEKIDEILKVAAANDGHCDRCLRVLRIYKYSISSMMAKVLREMAKETRSTNNRSVDMDTIELSHTERSQLSKMRQHGLITQPKDSRGVKSPHHWLITTKGWDFLGAKDVPAKVLVFDNQVLGHEGGMTNIRRLLDDPGFFESDPLSTAEATVYHDVRTPKKEIEYQAAWLGQSIPALIKDSVYNIKVERLQVGKPVCIVVTDSKGDEREYTYRDIATFARYWKIKES